MTDFLLNTDTLDRDAIADLAYRLWQQRGCPAGSGERDWYEAEALLREQSLRQSAATLETHETAPFAAEPPAAVAPRSARAPKAAKSPGTDATPRTRVSRSRPARPDA